MRQLPFNADVFEEAMEQPILHLGTSMDLFGDGSVHLFTHKSGYAGISYVARNNTEEDAIQLTLDLTGSENVCTHSGSLVAEIIVPPKQAKVMHHAAPLDDCQDWSVGWSCNARWLTDAEFQALSVADINLELN